MAQPQSTGAFQHSKTKSITSIGGQATEVARVYSGNAGIEFRRVIANGAANLRIDLPITLVQVVSLYMQAVGGALTVKTNDSGAPLDTIALVAGVIKDYDLDTPSLNFLGGVSNDTDITALYVSNASGGDVTLIVSAVLDATPSDD